MQQPYFAGGFELAAWCDFRIAAANAEFGCLSRRWGIPYTDGGTQRFVRIMGLGNALYLLETGVRIDARRAHTMGFVQEVVPEGQALTRALELAGFIASYPNLAGICADRQAALATYGLSLDEGLELLTGLPAGEANKKGRHPEGTVHGAVQRRLGKMADTLKAFGAPEEGGKREEEE